MSVLVSAKSITKKYGKGDRTFQVLGPVDIEIRKGTFCVILGRSGSGKSTLLNLLAGLDKASTGELFVKEINLSRLNSKKLAAYRSQNGIIFQSYNLLPNLNTVENVVVGAGAGGNKVSESEAEEVLISLGLKDRLKADIKTLSGGEKQRVAIARAIIHKPEILFCDEPTGALDSKSEEEVKQVLQDLNAKGITIIMVTHNPDFQAIADQTITLEDGKVIQNSL